MARWPTEPTQYRQLTHFALAVLALGTLGSCATDSPEAGETDLRSQVAEMNRRLTDAQVRLEEHAQRLALLEERSQAPQGAAETPPADLKVVKLVPEAAPVRTQGLTLRAQSATNEENAELAKRKARERDYAAANELYKARQCPEGGAAFGRFLASYGEGDFSANAHYGAAVCDVAARRFEQALGHLARAKSPEHEADALYLSGVSYAALGDKSKAREMFEELKTRFAGSPAAQRALSWLAEHPELTATKPRPD